MSDTAASKAISAATPQSARTVSAPHFTENLFAILSETFEGTRGIYLDKNTSFLDTLSAISAEEASRPVLGTTIAAQVYHTAYYVQAMARYFGGFEGKTDWDASWTTQTVDEQEWEALKTQLQDDYARAAKTLSAVTDWGEDALDYGMTIAVHSAYHLGAVRQLVKALREAA
jgi:hypothetical protein